MQGPPSHNATADAPAFARRYAWPKAGAGEGNRTLVSSLEGYSFTIKLHPRAPIKLARLVAAAKSFLDAARPVAFSSLRRLSYRHESLPSFARPFRLPLRFGPRRFYHRPKSGRKRGGE